MLIRKPQYLGLGAVAALTLALMNLPERAAARWEAGAGWLVKPFFAAAGLAEGAAASLQTSLMSRSELEREIQRLRRENLELAVQVTNRLGPLERDVAVLRQALRFQGENELPLLYAKIIGRDPSAWWRTVLVNRGRRHGVRVGDAVISEAGALGGVAEVSGGWSLVALLGDPSLRMRARVLETRETGFLIPEGGGLLNAGYVDMIYLPGASAARNGHRVVTTGIGPLDAAATNGVRRLRFPENILIGDIVDRKESGYGLFGEARVKLAVDSARLAHVWIVTR